MRVISYGKSKKQGGAEALQGDLITDSPDQMIRSFIDFSDEVF